MKPYLPLVSQIVVDTRVSQGSIQRQVLVWSQDLPNYLITKRETPGKREIIYTAWRPDIYRIYHSK